MSTRNPSDTASKSPSSTGGKRGRTAGRDPSPPFQPPSPAPSGDVSRSAKESDQRLSVGKKDESDSRLDLRGGGFVSCPDPASLPDPSTALQSSTVPQQVSSASHTSQSSQAGCTTTTPVLATTPGREMVTSLESSPSHESTSDYRKSGHGTLKEEGDMRLLEQELERQRELSHRLSSEKDNMERALKKQLSARKIDYEMALKESQAKLKQTVRQEQRKREEIERQLRVLKNSDAGSRVDKTPQEVEEDYRAKFSVEREDLLRQLQQQMSEAETSKEQIRQEMTQRHTEEIERLHAKLVSEKDCESHQLKIHDLHKQIKQSEMERRNLIASHKEELQRLRADTADRDDRQILLERERALQSRLERERHQSREAEERLSMQLKEKDRELQHHLLTAKRTQEDMEKSLRKSFEESAKSKQNEYEEALARQQREHIDSSALQRAQQQRMHERRLEEKERQSREAIAALEARDMQVGLSASPLSSDREPGTVGKIAELEATVEALRRETGEKERQIARLEQRHGASTSTGYSAEDIHSNVIDLARSLSRVVDPDNLEVHFKVERTLSLADVFATFHALRCQPRTTMPKAQSYLLVILPAPNNKDSSLMDFSGLFVQEEEGDWEGEGEGDWERGLESVASSEFVAVDEDVDDEAVEPAAQSMDEQNDLNTSFVTPLPGDETHLGERGQRPGLERSPVSREAGNHARQLRYAASEERCRTLEAEVHDLREKSAAMEDQVKDLDEQLTNTTATIIDKEQEIGSLKREVKQIESQLHIHMSSGPLSEKLHELQAIVASLRPYQTKAEEVERKLEVSKTSALETSQKIQLLTSKLEERDARLMSAHDELERLRLHLSQAERLADEMGKKFNARESEQSELLQQALGEQECLNAALRAKEEAMAARVTELTEALRQEQQHLAAETREMERLRGREAELAEALRSAGMEKQHDSATPPSVPSPVSQSGVPECSVDELTVMVAKLQLENANLKMQVGSFSTRMSESHVLLNQVQKQAKQIAGLKQTQEQIEAEKAEVLTELEHWKKSLDQLQQQLPRVEVDPGQSKCPESGATDALRRKAEHWHAEAERLEAVVKQLHARLNTLAATEQNRVELDQATLATNQILTEELQRCRDELHTASQRLLELEAVNVDLECRASGAAVLESDLSEAQQQADIRQKELTEFHRKICSLEKQNAEVKTECECIKLQADSYREDFQTERKDRENAMGKMVEERADMNLQLQRKQEEVKQGQMAIASLRSDLQNKLSTLSRKFETGEADLRQSRLQLKEARAQFEASKRQLEQVSKRLDLKQAETERLKEEVSVKTQQLKLYKKQADGYRAQYEGVQKANTCDEELQIQAATSESMAMAKTEELRKIQRERDDLIKEREVLMQYKAQLEQQLKSGNTTKLNFSTAFQRQYTQREEYQARYEELRERFDQIFQENDQLRQHLQQQQHSPTSKPQPTQERPPPEPLRGLLPRTPTDLSNPPLEQAPRVEALHDPSQSSAGPRSPHPIPTPPHRPTAGGPQPLSGGPLKPSSPRAQHRPMTNSPPASVFQSTSSAFHGQQPGSDWPARLAQPPVNDRPIRLAQNQPHESDRQIGLGNIPLHEQDRPIRLAQGQFYEGEIPIRLTQSNPDYVNPALAPQGASREAYLESARQIRLAQDQQRDGRQYASPHQIDPLPSEEEARQLHALQQQAGAGGGVAHHDHLPPLRPSSRHSPLRGRALSVDELKASPRPPMLMWPPPTSNAALKAGLPLLPGQTPRGVSAVGAAQLGAAQPGAGQLSDKPGVPPICTNVSQYGNVPLSSHRVLSAAAAPNAPGVTPRALGIAPSGLGVAPRPAHDGQFAQRGGHRPPESAQQHPTPFPGQSVVTNAGFYPSSPPKMLPHVGPPSQPARPVPSSVAVSGLPPLLHSQETYSPGMSVAMPTQPSVRVPVSIPSQPGAEQKYRKALPDDATVSKPIQETSPNLPQQQLIERDENGRGEGQRRDEKGRGEVGQRRDESGSEAGQRRDESGRGAWPDESSKVVGQRPGITDKPMSIPVDDEVLMRELDSEIVKAAWAVQANVEPDKSRMSITEDDIPLDPNLVCPTCGRSYRIGEIQRFRRHVAACH